MQCIRAPRKGVISSCGEDRAGFELRLDWIGERSRAEHEAVHQVETNVYGESVTVNGKRIERNYLMYSEIVNGGKIVFWMSDTPRNRGEA